MALHQRTRELIEAAREILAEHRPMTVRQVFYQLVSRQATENTQSRYNAVSKMLVTARKENIIPWKWIEDRLRRPRQVSMWGGLPDFAETVGRLYRRDVWPSQPEYFEVWVEKDALSGIFQDVLDDYGVALNVGRGYDGWDSIHNAAERFRDGEGAAILYFGDFDPSGEDMVRSLRDRLAFFGCEPEIIKCALTRADIERYSLPPALTKRSDTRRKAFVQRHGDVAVELDAMPINVLRERLVNEVKARMDMQALVETQRIEEAERQRVVAMMAACPEAGADESEAQ